jgi:predicted metal-dependent HD superfamily phosphohydrolase
MMQAPAMAYFITDASKCWTPASACSTRTHSALRDVAAAGHARELRRLLIGNRIRLLLRGCCGCGSLYRYPAAIQRGGTMRRTGTALHELLSAAGLSQPAEQLVLRRMGMPWRHYHGLEHLAVLWMRHRRYGTGTPFLAPAANRLIACAIAFHDAVYDATRRDNEHRSALLWQRYAPADLPPTAVDWVSDTIEATAHHLAVHDARTPDARLRLWLLDLDLTPLGDPAASFDRSTRRLRAEYRHMPEAEWNVGRLAFLRMLQAAPALFRSAPLAAMFEQQARRNIARQLHGM